MLQLLHLVVTLLVTRLEELLNCGNVAYSCFKTLKLKTTQLLRAGVGKVLMKSL